MSNLKVEALTADTQTNNLYFKHIKEGVFQVKVKNGVLGPVPTVQTEFCSLPPQGRKDENYRGIKVIPVKHGDFCTLKLRLSEEDSPELLKLCRNVLDKFSKAYDPITKSTWYQKQFKFEDGTKVYQATQAIANPDNYIGMELATPHNFDSPANTFGKALYGDGNDEPWYANFTLPQAKEDGSSSSLITNATLVLVDENGKKIKTKNINGNVLYHTSGISLTDTHALSKLFTSSFFKNIQWKCKVTAQVHSIVFKRATVSGTNDTVMFPNFKLKTVGTIVMKKYKYVQPEGVVPIDQRLALLEAALFAGLDAPPSKKRKRNIIKNEKPGVKVSTDFESELMEDSEVEGED